MLEALEGALEGGTAERVAEDQAQAAGRGDALQAEVGAIGIAGSLLPDQQVPQDQALALDGIQVVEVDQATAQDLGQLQLGTPPAGVPIEDVALPGGGIRADGARRAHGQG